MPVVQFFLNEILNHMLWLWFFFKLEVFYVITSISLSPYKKLCVASKKAFFLLSGIDVGPCGWWWVKPIIVSGFFFRSRLYLDLELLLFPNSSWAGISWWKSGNRHGNAKDDGRGKIAWKWECVSQFFLRFFRFLFEFPSLVLMIGKIRVSSLFNFLHLSHSVYVFLSLSLSLSPSLPLSLPLSPPLSLPRPISISVLFSRFGDFWLKW